MTRAASLVAVLLAAPSVHAEDLAAPEATAAEPEPIEVEVVGDRADKLQKIPGSFTVLGKQEIDRAAPLDTAEMLRRVPGLYVREDSAGGGRLDIGVRGLDPGRSRRLLVLEDGIPLAINPYAEPDLYFTPQLERFSKIEVLKGSGSILYGPHTIGGVVNFSTLPAPFELQSYASVDVGTFGYVRTLGRFGAPIHVADDVEPVRVLGQVVVKRSDGPRDQTSQDQDLLTKVVFPITRTSRATIKIAAHRAEAISEDVGLLRSQFARDPKTPGLSPESRMRLGRFDGSVVHETHVSDDVTLKTLGYVSVTDRVWSRQLYDRVRSEDTRYDRVVGDEVLPLGAIYFRDAARVLDRSYWVIGLEPRLTSKFRTGSVTHTLDTGMRVLGEHAELSESSRLESGVGALVSRDVHSTLALAAYAQDRVLVRDWLVVTPGVRVEHASYLTKSEISGGLSSDASGSSSSTAVIPGIGANLGVEELLVFGGLHAGYAPPRVTDTISAEGQLAQLSPERSTNWEAGLRSKPVPWLATEATFYLQRFSNQIVPNTSLDGTTELVNGGATESVGGEGALQVRVGTLADLDWEIDLGARGGAGRARFLGSQRQGKLLPYAPEGTFSGTFDVDAPFGLGAGFAASWTGGFYTDEANTEAADATGRVGRVDGYVTLDANARFREATTGLGASVAIKNLLDQPFLISRRPEGIWTSGFRQVIVGVSWQLPR